MSNERFKRRSIRLPEYDYARDGAYFVTICAWKKQKLFGDFIHGKLILNGHGLMTAHCWHDISNHFDHVELDEYVIMPNHVHGIIHLYERRGAACRAPTREQFGKPVAGSIPTIIRSFKSAVTKRIHESPDDPGIPIWQRNYFERVIRNDRELDKIRQYIRHNPIQWPEDELYH